MSNMGNRVVTGVLTLTGGNDRLDANSILNGSVSVAIKAGSRNVGSCYLGVTGVSSANGFELSAGQTLTMDLLNASALFVRGTAADTVSFLGLMP